MNPIDYFRDKMNQCRRLAKWTTDERTAKALEALASDFEAKGNAAEAEEKAIKARDATAGLLGNGKDGSLCEAEPSKTK